jgi:hypothetical protein
MIFPAVHRGLVGTAKAVQRAAGLVALVAVGLAQPGAAQPAAEPNAAQPPAEPTDPIATSFAINDADPESSVPSAQEAMRNPLQMGYLMMNLSDRGEAAMEQGKPAAAAKYFRAMGKAVPDRAVAFRKACWAHDAAGERDNAVETCRATLGKGGVTTRDHIQFVLVLLKKDGALSATDIGDIDAVVARLEGELALGAQESGGRTLADLKCQIGTRLEDTTRLSVCTQELRKLKVDRSKILAYEWALALSKGDTSEAEDVIEEAKRAGLPAAAIQSMQRGLSRTAKSGTDLKAVMGRWWPLAVAILVVVPVVAAIRGRRRSRPELV